MAKVIHGYFLAKANLTVSDQGMERNGGVRVSEFTEEDYIAAIERILGRGIYPNYPVEISRISQSREKDAGWDGVMNTLVPFYIQFKRSNFVDPLCRNKLAKDRLKLGMDGNGFFTFSLHRDKGIGGFGQHNTLFKLGEVAKVAYVAPLFYKRSGLSRLKDFDRYPWGYKSISISEVGHECVNLNLVRTFVDSVAIPPHREILDRASYHGYAFDRKGNISFHSDPERVDGRIVKLGDFLIDVYRSSEEGRFVQERLLKVLPGVVGASWESYSFLALMKGYLLSVGVVSDISIKEVREFVFEGLDVVSRFLVLEEFLRDQFRIIQFVMRLSDGV